MNDELPPKVYLSAEEYARLQSVLADSGVDALVLPGGGHALLEKRLTCGVCGVYVCYRHNPELDPGALEGIRLPHPRWNRWSRPVHKDIIRRFQDQLVLIVTDEALDITG